MVDDELEPRRLHHRQVRWLRALEDAAGICADVAITIRQVRSVARQPADLGSLAVLVDCGYRMARRQLRQLDTPVGQERSSPHQETVGPVARKICEGCID